MSDTPRTDHLLQHGLELTGKNELAWLCQDLERDLAAARAECEMEKLVAQQKAERLAACEKALEERDAECDRLREDAERQHVATVAEVHMSRYTLEWTNGPLPEGTKLYARKEGS